jgi:hypothetical protein
VIDALVPEQLEPGEAAGLLLARCGPLSLVIECADRDGQHLVAGGPGDELTIELEREDLVLVGFANRERRRLYRALRAVAGIGRRSALALLDCGEVGDTLRAVAARDAEYFRLVPGLGQKRIGAVIAQLERRYDGALPRPLPVAVRSWVEARDALVLEGESFDRAEELLYQAIGGEEDGLEMDAEALLELARTSGAG